MEIDMGIIGAMGSEVKTLKSLMTNTTSEKISGIEFITGTLEGKTVVIAACGIGKVFAGICAEIMILKYAPKCIVNSGVGGNLTDKMTFGDISVAKDVVQHDMDTSPIGDPVGLLSGLGIFMTADEKINALIMNAAKEIGLNCVEGTIASGDQFIATKEQKNKILTNFPTAVTCEMEGGAIGQVCTLNKVPFAVIRAISDNVDGTGPENFGIFLEKAVDNTVKVMLKVLRGL